MINIFDVLELLDDLLETPYMNLSERRIPQTHYILRRKPPKKKKPVYRRPTYMKSAKRAQIDEDYSGLLDAFNMR